VWVFRDRPDLAALNALENPAAKAGHPGVTVTFLGVSTLLISDGETSLMTDGFFSRPGLWPVLAGLPIPPDPERIAAGLAIADVDRLAAVLVVHSHFDHAMDAPEVARRTGAVVVGSASTANVARGVGFPEDRIRVVESGRPMTFGAFTVTFVTSRHFPLPPPGAATLGREIEEPLVPPVPALAYLEGGSYSIFVTHPEGTALIQGSAGFVEGALEPYAADVVLLGVGGLGTKDRDYFDDYWRNVVTPVGAQRVLPIHYDDFTLPFERGLVPMPRLLDGFDRTLDFLIERAGAEPGIALQALPPFEPMALFPRSRAAR
jgi:L-ascorbate metabolism protein UlaG (beta-lactamase superfamily)